MKNLILTAILAFTSLTATANNQEIYQLSVNISDMIYDYDSEFTSHEKTQLREQFQIIESIVRGEMRLECGTPQSTYRAAFTWARSSEGLNAIRSDAMELAQEISGKSCSMPYFNRYAESYTWAHSPDGLTIHKSKAMEFASLSADHDEQTQFLDKLLDCIRPQFEFARSSEGLNYSRRRAEEFAKQQCGILED